MILMFFVLPQQPPDQSGSVRGRPVHYHHNLPEVPLHLLEMSNECGRIKPLVRPEELPPVLGDGTVHDDLPVASGVRHDDPLPLRGSIFAAGRHVVDKEDLVHDGEFVLL